MMTTKDFSEFSRLNEVFIKDCERIARILERECVDWSFIDEWRLEDGYVGGRGTERWAYGGYEEYSLSFPAKYLTMTDDELNAIVDAQLEAKKKREDEEKRKKDEVKQAQERAEYERLKKIYG